MQDEKNHEERRVRNEQKAADKKVRDEATAAERERRRAEKGATEPGKSRLFPSFLGRGGVAAGTAAGAGTAAVAEGGVDAAGGGAGALTDTTTVPATAAEEDVELTGETVHDQVTTDAGQGAGDEGPMNLGGPTHDLVTVDADEKANDPSTTDSDEAAGEQFAMDPGEAAHAVAAADAEATPKATEVPLPADEEVGPTDTTGAKPYSGTSPLKETTSPVSPISQTSPASPSKRDSRVKSFLKKFRSGSKSENVLPPGQPLPAATEAKEDLTDAGRTAEPIKEEDQAATDSIRDVAFAGRSDNETEDMYGGSVKLHGRVSPIHDEPGTGGSPGPAVADETGGRDISPPSDKSSLDEEPYVIAADVASSRYSTEKAGSKRDSGMDQIAPEQTATLTDEDEEPRGRKGFRERFLKKVIPGRDKEKKQAGQLSSSAVATGAPATAPRTTNAAVTQSTARGSTSK